MNELKEIFNLYERKYKNEEISAENLKSMLKDLDIVLYGAGNCGVGVLHGLRKIGIHTSAWLDMNYEKWGTVFENMPVSDPGKYNVTDKTLVIVCINTDGKNYCKSLEDSLRTGGHSAVYKNLQGLGYTKIVDYSHFWRCYELFENSPYLMPSVSDVRYTLSHREEIYEAYDLLSDDYSKEVFRAVLTFQLIDRNTQIPTNDDFERYFAPNLFTIDKNDYFVDCGAYDGMYLDRFLKYSNGDISGYAGFECDPDNFNKLETKINGIYADMKFKLKTFQTALYDKKGVVSFYSLKGPGSFVSDTGTATVACDTLDNVLKHEKPTFIKMNITNSELPALKGGVQIIKNNSPILSVSNYYQTRNIWQVFFEFKKLDIHYNCYMRSYMKNLSLVAYAVPNDRVKQS